MFTYRFKEGNRKRTSQNNFPNSNSVKGKFAKKKNIYNVQHSPIPSLLLCLRFEWMHKKKTNKKIFLETRIAAVSIALNLHWFAPKPLLIDIFTWFGAFIEQQQKYMDHMVCTKTYGLYLYRKWNTRVLMIKMIACCCSLKAFSSVLSK